MNLPTRQTLLQAYQVVLYQQALHPEHFELKGRRVVRHGSYELEVWILQGQHVLRFEQGDLCASELVSDHERGVPQQGIVSAFLCAGEHEFDHYFPTHRVNYMTTVQTETLSDNLYQTTFQEMLDLARETRALTQRWTTDEGDCLSLVDVQPMAREVHVQCYHMLAGANLVLRTQSIFEQK